MTTDDPTVDDLRTIASNLRAEGQNSRALLIDNAVAELEALQAKLARQRAVMEAARKTANDYISILEEEWKSQDGGLSKVQEQIIADGRAALAAEGSE